MCVCLYATDVIIILLGYQYNMEFPINDPLKYHCICMYRP